MVLTEQASSIQSKNNLSLWTFNVTDFSLCVYVSWLYIYIHRKMTAHAAISSTNISPSKVSKLECFFDFPFEVPSQDSTTSSFTWNPSIHLWCPHHVTFPVKNRPERLANFFGIILKRILWTTKAMKAPERRPFRKAPNTQATISRTWGRCRKLWLWLSFVVSFWKERNGIGNYSLINRLLYLSCKLSE